MIIGLHGLARSGKTTATGIIAEELGNACQVEAFADPIKAMLNAVGVDCSDHLKDKVHPVFKKTPRELMNLLGTEWGRKMIHPDIWADILHNKRDSNVLVVSDVRMENEADSIRSRGGVIIHIVGRGGIPGNYETEQGIKVHSDDYIIPNDSSLNNFKHNIQQVLIEILV